MNLESINWRRALAIAGTLVVVAVVVPFAVFAVPQAVGADHSYVVLSGSMEPAISPGDVVIVGAVSPTDIAVDDVITFYRTENGIPTTHRVVEVLSGDGGLAFRTMGDANEDPDGAPVPAGNVVGRVVFTIPFIGYVIEAGKTPVGFAALVVVPFGLLLASELYDMMRRRGSNDSTADDADGGESSNADDEPRTDDEHIADEDPSADEDAPAGVVLTEQSLLAAAVVLAPATAYAAFVVYAVKTPWAVGALTAGVVGLAFLGYVRYATGSGVAGGVTHADGGVDADAFVSGRYPDGTESIALGSLADLQAVAERASGVVVHDDERARYFVSTDAATYAYDELVPEDER